MKKRNLAVSVTKIVLILLVLMVALRILLPTINSPQFQAFTQSIGPWGYLVVIGYIVLSHVIAPLAGSPGVALAITVYGIHTGSWLLYVASLISATINFTIAKRYGRKWVIKLVGKESMRKVDEFATYEGRDVLILARLFGFSLFDFISYAAGLTTIRFREYFLITAFFGLIPNLVMQHVFKNIDFSSQIGVLVWGLSIIAVAVIFGLVLKLYIKRKKGQGGAEM